MQTEREVTASQRIAALAPGLHAGTARDQQGLSPWLAIHDPLEPVFPVWHLVDLVQCQKARIGVPALPIQDVTISQDIPVEVLSGREAGHELAAKGGLAHLARTGEQDQLTAEVGRNLIHEVAFHADYFSGYWKIIETIFQYLL